MKKIEFQVTVHSDSRLGKELALLPSGRARSRRVHELATEALFAASIGVFARTASPTSIESPSTTAAPPVEPQTHRSDEIAAIATGLFNQLDNLKEGE